MRAVLDGTSAGAVVGRVLARPGRSMSRKKPFEEDPNVMDVALNWTEPLLPAGLQETRPTRVLIVDDDREIRSLLEETLSEEGYSPLTAPDALSALILLLGEGADILVTDWKMPTADGLDLLDSVRRCLPNLPVIFLTAYADALLKKQAMSRGA